MKFRLVAFFAILAFVSCQKSVDEDIEDPSSQELVGTYDLVAMTSAETSISIDTIDNVISKMTLIDSNWANVCTGTLQITSGQFSLNNFNVSGSTSTRSVTEVQGQQPFINEFTEEFGFDDPTSFTCDYTKKGVDSILLTSIPDLGDPTETGGTVTQHYRFSGDTLILTTQERSGYHYSDQGTKSSYEEIFWQRLKFKRKK